MKLKYVSRSDRTTEHKLRLEVHGPHAALFLATSPPSQHRFSEAHSSVPGDLLGHLLPNPTEQSLLTSALVGDFRCGHREGQGCACMAYGISKWVNNGHPTLSWLHVLGRRLDGRELSPHPSSTSQHFPALRMQSLQLGQQPMGRGH